MTPLARRLAEALVAGSFTLASLVAPAQAQPGALDPAFGAGGVTRIGFGDGEDESYSVVALANGGYLVAGSAGDYPTLVRYLSNGTPDPSFGVRGVARLGSRSPASAWAVDLQFDGRIVVIGRDSSGPFVTRFLSDGTFDSTFGVGGFAELPALPGLTLTSLRVVGGDAVLLAGALSNGLASNGSFVVCRLTASGFLDPSFDGDGQQVTSMPTPGYASSMTLQSDGKIVLAGSVSNVGGGRSLALVRYTSNGALDTSFDGDGRVITTIGASTASSSVNAIVTQAVSGSADKLLVAGSTTITSVNSDGVLARYNLNGTLDTSFGTGGVVVQAVSSLGDEFRSLRFVPGADRFTPSRIFVAGYATFPSTQPNMLLCAYTISGSLNTSFSGDGMVIEAIGTGQNEAFSLAFSNERLVVTGMASQGTQRRDLLLARFLASNGAFDPSFDGDGIRLDDIGDSKAVARALARQADGRIVVAGSSRNGNLQVVARLLANGTPDSSFSSDARASIVTGGSISYLTDVAVQPDQKLVVAGTTLLNNVDRVTVARLLANGSPDPAFGGAGLVFLPPRSPDEYDPQLAIQSDGKLLLASTSSGGADDSVRVTRLLANGGVDVSFGVGGSVMLAAGGHDLRFFAFTMQADGRSLVVGQRRRFVSPQMIYEVVATRLTTAGAIDTTFGAHGVVTLLAGSTYYPGEVLVQSDGRIVVTGVQQVTATNRDPWAFRLTADGQPDDAYGVQGCQMLSTSALDETMGGATLQSFDRLVVVGRVGTDFVQDVLVARSTNTGAPDPTFAGDGIAAFDLAPFAGDAAYDVLPDVAGGPLVVAGESAGLMSILAVQPGAATAGVDATPEVTPAAIALAAPWPNPSRGSVTLALRLATAAALRAEVLDLQGRRVRSLASGETFAAGEARLHWDGRDARGEPVPPGLYLVRVRAAGVSLTRRVVVAR